MPDHSLSRRQAIGTVGLLVAGSAGLSETTAVGEQTGARTVAPAAARLAPRVELVNTLEYEAQAKLALAPAVYQRIAGSERAAFDRVTLRPRMMVPTIDMELSVTLFGDTHFAPILVAPIAEQRAFHADAETATAKGAAAAKAGMVVSSRTSVALATLAPLTTSPVWFQVFANDAAAATQSEEAAQAGCKVICVTVGATAVATVTRREWDAVAALRQKVRLPLVVKGIATPEAAVMALQQRADGIIASSYRGTGPSAQASPILTLPGIVDAVAGKVPVLVDGSFRRGTDILKALAFGAKGVLVGRPVMWGLAAYGSDGVQGVLEMLQTELGRYMGMCGKSNLGALDRSLVVVHAERAAREAGSAGPGRRG